MHRMTEADRMRKTVCMAGAVTALLSAAISCRRTTPVEREPLVRRAMWYNFYRRGVWRAGRGDWENALADFETALGVRGGGLYGDDRERWRAKTYGLHFLDDYFPHRERGVCLLRLGRLEAAEAALAESLRQVPSGRAKHFLNSVRQRRLREGQAAEPARIEFELEAPEGVWYVNTPVVKLRGRIRSPHRVAAVALDGTPLFIELAEEVIELDREARVGPGGDELTVRASDLLGRESVWRKRVVVDLAGPSVSVSRGTGVEAGKARVHVSDDVGLASVTLDGKARALAPETRELSLAVPFGKGTRAEIRAEDRAGNVTVFELNGDERAGACRESFDVVPDRLLAWAGTAAGVTRSVYGVRRCAPLWQRTECGPVGSGRERPFRGAEREGGAQRTHSKAAAPQMETRLADAGGWMRLPALVATADEDTMPPLIKLFPEVEESVRVTSACYFVDVLVEEESLASLVFAVNGAQQPMPLRGEDIRVRRMTRRLELAEGRNEFEIRATDRAGNVRVRRFDVHRVPPAARDVKLRMTAQVLLPRDRAPRELSRLDFYGQLMQELWQSGRLNLLERDPLVLERILLELKLSGSGLTDYKRALRAGKMEPAEWILNSRLSVHKGGGYGLVGEVVDVETGQTLLLLDVYLATAEREEVRYQLGGFAEKLRQALPVRSAAVKSVSGADVEIALGSRDGIKTGMRFLFIPSESEFPKPVEHEGKRVQGKISYISTEACLVEMLPEGAAEAVKAGDAAVLR